MAKKRGRPVEADSKRSQGVDRHMSPRIAFHLPKELMEAVEAYVRSSVPRPSVTALCVAALEEFLAKRGALPGREKASEG